MGLPVELRVVLRMVLLLGAEGAVHHSEMILG